MGGRGGRDIHLTLHVENLLYDLSPPQPDRQGHALRFMSTASSNVELRKDPDDDLRIVREAVKFVEAQTKDLEEQGGSWKHYICGHSLGGATASCVAVALPDTITQ